MNLKRSKGRILPAICIIVALSFEGISASTSTPNHDPSKEDFATSTRNWSETSRQLEAQKDDKDLNEEVDTPHALRRRVKSEHSPFFLPSSFVRASSKKGSKKSSKKGSKGAKGSKAPKTPKQTKATKANGELKEDLAKAIIMKERIQAAFKYDATSARLCMNASDNHQHCVYEILIPGTDFACECRPTNGAQVFGEVDANDDDFITLAEILSYFDSQDCDFPFKYTVEGVTKSYDSCTTVDDDFGFSWCSIRNLSDGSYATGFFKYCDESSNVLVWNDALDRLDSDGDGKLSFDEAIHNARRRRKLLSSPGAFGAEWNCNDCVVPDDCTNPVIKAIDGECRNYIKTRKLDDQNLLRLLASTMADVYCPKDDETIGGYWSHTSCERKREGMENWLTRDDANMKMYDGDAGQLYTFLACSALTVSSLYNGGASLLRTANGLLNLFESDWGVSTEQCINVLVDMPSRLDGKDALQYATYTINQGQYQGQTILAFMGTVFSNIEQVVADIWSTPMSTDLMKNMANEAKDVAERLNPDFITGHSLGGIIAEMVCSMTGIKGASFGAIGAFDPFTKLDEVLVDAAGLAIGMTGYATSLSVMGYDEDDIEEHISNLNVGEFLIRTRYNGLILDTQHDDVEFEVVMNVHDILARTIASIDGSACSHIASSCDLRWLWFGGGNVGTEKTLGHSSTHYVLNTNSKWTRGYEEKSQATIDYTKIFLPGVTKNTICDFCDRNEYCESGSCDLDKEKCLASNGKFPTKCPDDSATPGEHSPCDWGSECSSGRCEIHPSGWAVLGYGLCYDGNENSDWCNEDTDCASGYCTLTFGCARKKNIGESCVENDDCNSNNCNWWFQCS